uniref:glycosyltransferase n=1 Tax=Jeotgalibaca arthritidis TaxID=1868794 RepID=UPI0035A17D62
VVYHAHSTEEDFRNSFLFSNVLSPLFRKWIIRCYNLGDIVITPTPYAGTDLFFFPTYEETEGIVLLEAMAMGKTCLIRDIPIYADYQDASHLYKASDQESFYTAINHILEGDWPSLQQTSLQAVQQRDIKEIGKQLKEAYQDAIKIKHGSES